MREGVCACVRVDGLCSCTREGRRGEGQRGEGKKEGSRARKGEEYSTCGVKGSRARSRWELRYSSKGKHKPGGSGTSLLSIEAHHPAHDTNFASHYDVTRGWRLYGVSLKGEAIEKGEILLTMVENLKNKQSPFVLF